MKPPSFLNRKEEQGQQRLSKKGQPTILCIEVQITPTDCKHIQIRDGDDPEALARDFCRKYGLNKDMEENLVDQLKRNIGHYERQRQNQPMVEKEQASSTKRSLIEAKKEEKKATFKSSFSKTRVQK